MIDSFLKNTAQNNKKEFVLDKNCNSVENDSSDRNEFNKEYMKGIYGLSTSIGATFNDMDINALYLSRILLEQELDTEFHLSNKNKYKKYIDEGLEIYKFFLNKNTTIKEECSSLSSSYTYDIVEIFIQTKKKIGYFYNEYYNIYRSINQSNNEIYIEIPNFDQKFIYNKLGYSIETTMNGLSMKYSFFRTVMENIKIKGQNVIYFVPNVIMPVEIPFWRSFMNEYNKEGNSKLGIIIDNEAIIDHLESYMKIDYFIIDIDKLWLEFSEKPEKCVDKKHFMLVLGEVLREIHTVLKAKNKKHMIKGEMIYQQDIFEKFFKMGYRSFIINKKQENVFKKAIKNYAETRGKYKGVYAQNKNKKII